MSIISFLKRTIIKLIVNSEAGKSALERQLRSGECGMVFNSHKENCTLASFTFSVDPEPVLVGRLHVGILYCQKSEQCDI